MHTVSLVVLAICLGLFAGSVAAAAEPVISVDARYLEDERLLEGTYELSLEPNSEQVYFMLLPNLNRERNPYQGERQQDEIYPHGFERSSLSVLSAQIELADSWEELSIRLLALPPAWQTLSLEGSVLVLDLPRAALDAGERIHLRCAFITEIPRTSLGDEAITDDVLTWRFGWFPILLPEQSSLVEIDGQLAYANRSAFPLAFPWATIEAQIEIPAGAVLLSGADTAETTAIGTDENPRTLVTLRNAAPSRSLAVAIGMEYEMYRLPGAVPVEVAYLPHHEEEARVFATLALDILQEFEERYGPYPRAKLTIVENPNQHGQSFAADGIVWLSARFFTHRNVLFPGALNRIAEYVLAHEIAHQWVGLGTGIDLNAEAWLSEGLAQYLAVRYFESKYESAEPNLFAPQVPGIVGELVDRQFGYLNMREHFIELPYLLSLYEGFDEELIKPIENVLFGNASSVRLYDKGYLVARALAAHVGLDAFERGLKQAILEKRADFLDARAFQHILESVSGLSLEEHFDYWVFGPGWADYRIRVQARSHSELGHETVVIVSRDGGTPQQVTLEATMQSGGTVRQTWDGVKQQEALVFHTPSWVSRVSVDPDHVLPDRNRLNNHAPVKIVGAVNKNALPLDAYVLAPDELSGGLIISHLDRLRIAIGEQEASAMVKLSRNERVSLHARFADSRFTGSLSYNWTEYSVLETGSAAQTWVPTMVLSIVGERFVDAILGPIHALRVETVIAAPPDPFRRHQIMIRMSPIGTAQAVFSIQDEVRLLPGIYLQAEASVGVSSGELPDSLQFKLTELRSIEAERSDHMAVGSLLLELPGAGNLPYSLFHLAMVDGVRTRGFVTCGAGWTTPDEFGTTSASIEAGLEQIVELSTLGGMLSATVTLGFATPIRGAGEAVFYATISL